MSGNELISEFMVKCLLNTVQIGEAKVQGYILRLNLIFNEVYAPLTNIEKIWFARVHRTLDKIIDVTEDVEHSHSKLEKLLNIPCMRSALSDLKANLDDTFTYFKDRYTLDTKCWLCEENTRLRRENFTVWRATNKIVFSIHYNDLLQILEKIETTINELKQIIICIREV
jgi:hypothetical protein